MTRPLHAGEDGLQMCRAAVNVLNKQSRTVDKGWFSSLGVGRGANYSSPWKENLVTEDFGHG
jgi:hypothetical protein